MANLAVTSRCQASCAFCFSRSALTGLGEMCVEDFGDLLDRLEEPVERPVGILGGEPSLHPGLPAMVAAVVARGRRAVIFTNGEMPPAMLERLCAQAGPVLFVVNASGWLPQAAPPPALEATLARLGDRAELGLTLDRDTATLEPLLEVVARLGLAPRVRVGIALPVADGANAHLHPRHYRGVGARLLDFMVEARARGVAVDLDCGLVPCMFPPGPARDALLPPDLGLRCGPVPDLLPDGTAIPCFPLAALARERLGPGDRIGDVRRRLARALEPLAGLGIFPGCQACADRREGRCLGGCRAVAARRLVQAEGAAADAAETVPPRDRRLRLSGGLPILQAPAGEARAGRGAAPAGLVIPYVDQPPEFWASIEEELGERIEEVYFPLPADAGIGSGRPRLPEVHLSAFLARARTAKSVLVNALTLPAPVEEVAGPVIERLRALAGDHGIRGATVSHLSLAQRIREAMPSLRLTASVLLDVATPLQAAMLGDAFDALVPASRIVRDLRALQALRRAFRGELRLLVNEACLPGCPYRTQHFHEMGSGVASPRSLCAELLEAQPWLRLTGAWVLPQHLGHYAGLFDTLKLAGRVTLRDPARYREVLLAYANGRPLAPHQIGGGPASPLGPIEVSEEFFLRTLHCDRDCDRCRFCRDAWAEARTGAGPSVVDGPPA